MAGWERTYRGEATVQAAPEEVWAVLTDLEAYPEWNPFTLQVRSSLVPGEAVWMKVDLGWLTLWQRETVLEVLPPRHLHWHIASSVPWLLRAKRTQVLTPRQDGGTHYTTVDVIGGLLSPLVDCLFGRGLRAGFAGVAEALKTRVEG